MSSAEGVEDRVLEFVVIMTYPPSLSIGATEDLIQGRIRHSEIQADGGSVESIMGIPLTTFGLQGGRPRFSITTFLARQPLGKVSSCWKNGQQDFTRRWEQPVVRPKRQVTSQSLLSAWSRQFLEPQGTISLSCTRGLGRLEAQAWSRWQCMGLHVRSEACRTGGIVMWELVPLGSSMVHGVELLFTLLAGGKEEGRVENTQASGDRFAWESWSRPSMRTLALMGGGELLQL